MTTNQLIAAHPIVTVDPTHLDPTGAAGAHAGVDPFGIIGSITDRIRATAHRARLARATRRHDARTRRVLASDARMRAEFDAHWFGI